MKLLLVLSLILAAALLFVSFAGAGELAPNELGRIMILEYHKVDYPEATWTRNGDEYPAWPSKGKMVQMSPSPRRTVLPERLLAPPATVRWRTATDRDPKNGASKLYAYLKAPGYLVTDGN